MIQLSHMPSYHNKVRNKWLPSTYPEIISGDWDELVDVLALWSELDTPSKDRTPLISAALYGDVVYRHNDNVIAWDLAILDMDEGCPLSVGEMTDHLDHQGLAFTIYTSARSIPEQNKYRVVLPMSRRVLRAEIGAFWYALAHHFNCWCDPACKDMSRAYYRPARYPGAHHAFVSRKNGLAIDPDILMTRFPMSAVRETNASSTQPGDMSLRLSGKPSPRLLAMRQRLGASKTLAWSGAMDCPFIKGHWWSDYQGAGQGEHHLLLFKVMTSINAVARLRGYELTAHELAQLAWDFDRACGGRTAKDRNLLYEAGRIKEKQDA